MGYITLPSNASMHLYPNNTMQNYKTQVAITEEFLGKWEVGMVSISYPAMWYNVAEEDTACYVFMADDSIRKCAIQSGRYTSVEQLVKALNDALDSTIVNGLSFFNLTYDALTRKVTYRMGERTVADYDEHPEVLGSSFSKCVTHMLGFEDFWNREYFPEDKYAQNMVSSKTVERFITGAHVADLNRGIHSLYVYSDIVEPCHVGDAIAPLLRVVPLSQMEFRESTSSLLQCTQNFTRVHYHPLSHTHIKTVEIDIKDSRGHPIPFERGELIVTLHIRRVKPIF